MMTDAQKKMKKYCTAIERRLNLPRDVKVRVMTDFTTTIAAMRESGKTDEEIYTELGNPKKVAADLNEQMKEFAYRKSPWRYVFLAAAVLSGLWLAAYRLALWLFQAIGLMISPSEASSLGVIGGADGPTAIFITGVRSGFDWDLLIITAVLAVGIVGFLRLRRCKPKM